MGNTLGCHKTSKDNTAIHNPVPTSQAPLATQVVNGKLVIQESPAKKGNNKKTAARLKSALFTGDVKDVATESTIGLIKFTINEAELEGEKPYYTVVSIGRQIYVSKTSKATSNPKWKHEDHNLVLQKGEATSARLAVHAGKGASALVGYCEVDLEGYFSRDGLEPVAECWQDLKDPSDSSRSVGRINFCAQASTLDSLEQNFWKRILALADLDDDGRLSFDEFHVLMKAFGNDLTTEALKDIFQKVDADSDGSVSEDELAACLTTIHEKGQLHTLMKRCPVDGADLVQGDDFGNLIYMTLCMDEGTGVSLQGAGGESDHSRRSWMLKLSEWGISRGSHRHSRKISHAASGSRGVTPHILVYDRASKRVEEEQISAYLILAMRNMYQSKIGKVMLKSGAHVALQELSERQGRKMDSPESVEEIPEFLESFKGSVDISEAEKPLSEYHTFNEFFYRRLKPEARPIANAEDPTVIVSGADCRLMAYSGVDAATRCWIKGRHFSLAGLLADKTEGAEVAHSYEGGDIFIFRLAPQDYHRFHFPVGGVFESQTLVSGRLYTVNPIAVSSPFANVFTQNTRSVCFINSPECGRVAFIAIGATMVGSICFTAEVGKTYKKGDEMGYFAFGGSTTIALFKQGSIIIDPDIAGNSLKSLETLVKMGERLAVTPKSPFQHTESEIELIHAEVDERTSGFEGLTVPSAMPVDSSESPTDQV